MTQAQITIPLHDPRYDILTIDDCHLIQINSATYYLDELIAKPGFEILKHIADSQKFFGHWQAWGINASHCYIKNGNFLPIRSRYDGTKFTPAETDILMLLKQHHPSFFILPEGEQSNALIDVCQELNILCFQPYSLDTSEKTLPNYHFINNGESITEHDIKPHDYVAGFFSVEAYQHIIKLCGFVEPYNPFDYASKGWINIKNIRIDINDSNYENQHVIIDESCECPVCKQSLTKAYLHHLWQNTPLLCQRYLALHNGWCYTNKQASP